MHTVKGALNTGLIIPMVRKKKIGTIVRALPKVIIFVFSSKVLKMGGQTFVFRGRSYTYFSRSYNTFDNPRRIEIPIVMDEITRLDENKEILELGNVMSNYYAFPHDVVDRYEKAKGVVNEDIATFCPRKRYDLIVSISTLEHVGWDESPKDGTKISSAVANLRKLCKPGGQIIITFPVGYNSILDRLIKECILRFDELYFLRRVSKLNEWKEATSLEVKHAKYGYPYPKANVIGIGYIRI